MKLGTDEFHLDDVAFFLGGHSQPDRGFAFSLAPFYNNFFNAPKNSSASLSIIAKDNSGKVYSLDEVSSVSLDDPSRFNIKLRAVYE